MKGLQGVTRVVVGEEEEPSFETLKSFSALLSRRMGNGGGGLNMFEISFRKITGQRRGN